MALDPDLATRLAAWFQNDPPAWAERFPITRRVPDCLAIAAARGTHHTNREVGAAFFIAEGTAKTYLRDSASEWCMTHSELQRAAVSHIAHNNPELLFELLGELQTTPSERALV